MPSFEGHSKQETALAFSPDGKYGLLATEEGVHVWRVKTGKQVRLLDCRGNALTAVAVSRDGKTVAAFGADGTLRFWELATGKAGKAHETEDRPPYTPNLPLSFSPDDRRVILTGAGRVRSWEVASGKEHVYPDGTFGERRPDREGKPHRGLHVPANPQAVSPDGKMLAAHAHGHRLQLFDATSGKSLHSFEGHEGTVLAVAISSKGVLATGGVDRMIRLWDSRGKLLRTLQGSGSMVNSLSFSPDGAQLVSAAFGYPNEPVSVWDVETGKRTKQLNVGAMSAPGPVFRADGKEVLVLSSPGGAAAWDPTTGKQVKHYWVDFRNVHRSFDRKHLITSDPTNGDLFIGDADKGKDLQTIKPELPEDEGAISGSLHRRNVVLMGGTADGRILMTVDHLNRAATWDTKTGKRLRTFTLSVLKPAGLSVIRGPEFTPDGRLFILSDRTGYIHIVETATGLVRRSFDSTHANVFALALSNDGRTLLTAGDDSTALVWHLARLPDWKARKMPLNRRDLDEFWKDLGSGDGSLAEAAIRQLSTSQDGVVPFLAGKLKPAPTFDQATIDRHVADLRSTRFAVRKAAEDALARIGKRALPALKKVLSDRPELELKRRIELLMKQIDRADLSQDVLQQVRAVEVLEHIRTPEALKVIEALAKGATEDILTTESEAALRRLRQ
jgi:WD40 repeat protein